VEALGGGQAQSLALPVEVAAPLLQPDVDRPLPGSPDPTSERRARRLHADGKMGQPRLDHRIDMGDQGCPRHARHLGRERRRQGEDVADHHMRAHLLQQRQQCPCRPGRVAILGRIGAGRGVHPVFLGGGEAQSRALDGSSPLLPALDRHFVAASGQRPAQGDRRKDVARIAEGGDQESARGYRGPHRGG